jgi:glycosyltransferase A (GT-A) superfamily protein (DUF2064 family)
MRARALVLFARSPWREAAAKGLRGDSAALFRRLTTAWMRSAAACGARVIVACDDADREALGRIEPSIDRLTLTQRGATFGERLANAADDAFALHHERVIVAGIDAPPPDLNRAFALLEEHEIVAAPARDGGVNLIGLRAPAHALLASIEIGQRCINAFASAAILASVTDIDSPADLARAAQEAAWRLYLAIPHAATEYAFNATPAHRTPQLPSRAPPPLPS